MTILTALTGNPGDGFNVHGPFDDGEAAGYAMEYSKDEWWLIAVDNSWIEHKWDLPLIQFARLISELEAAGAFTEQVVQDLQTSMDLHEDAVTELIDRAQAIFDEAKVEAAGRQKT